jgi:hypothetical protein
MKKENMARKQQFTCRGGFGSAPMVAAGADVRWVRLTDIYAPTNSKSGAPITGVGGSNGRSVATNSKSGAPFAGEAWGDADGGSNSSTERGFGGGDDLDDSTGGDVSPINKENSNTTYNIIYLNKYFK